MTEDKLVLVDSMPRKEKLEIEGYGQIMAGDKAIIEAARISTNQALKSVKEDIGVINYMMRNRHTTPFEMVEFKFKAKMPIFVARQWIRHRTASVNEYSLRYSECKDEFWCPSLEEVKGQGMMNKQGSEDTLSEDVKRNFKADTEELNDASSRQYHLHLKAGVSRELARVNLPLTTMTEWFWKIDLHNLFHFLQLRMDEHAQEQIREYALKMGEIVKEHVPWAWEAFRVYRLESMTLSAKEVELLKRINENGNALKNIIFEDYLAKSEVAEFRKKLQRLGM